VTAPIARLRKVCLDAVEPATLGPWWARVLDLEWRPAGDEGGIHLPGQTQPVIWVNRVPEPKTVKHRWHLDIYAAGLDGLLAAGATVVLPEGDDRRWTVLADPEGGEFCAFVRPEPVPEPRLHGLVVDCADPAGLSRWWVGVLGGQIRDNGPNHTEVSNVPGMTYTFDFVRVPEPKAAKNRIHLDLTVEEVEPLLAAGATVLRAPDGEIDFHVLADPEGNELCAFPYPPGA
jgi:hypothetical protein